MSLSLLVYCLTSSGPGPDGGVISIAVDPPVRVSCRTHDLPSHVLVNPSRLVCGARTVLALPPPLLVLPTVFPPSLF